MRKTAGSLASWTAESYRYESVATSTTGRDTNIQQNQREGKRMAETYDLAIVGGGIVGLATCFQLSQRAPGLKIILLEKENAVGSHQSSRNSGVLHSGIYYPLGSAKATHCIEGKSMMEQFCQEHQIPWERCGKVIVATEGAQV
ncbi:MAG: FAD-dependent oxidoreductase, partial [Pirellulaceae bacterium]